MALLFSAVVVLSAVVAALGLVLLQLEPLLGTVVLVVAVLLGVSCVPLLRRVVR